MYKQINLFQKINEAEKKRNLNYISEDLYNDVRNNDYCYEDILYYIDKLKKYKMYNAIANIQHDYLRRFKIEN